MVQFPESTQGFNRYTYVNNNPLSYTDPSGFGLSRYTKRLAAAVFISPYIPQIEYAAKNPQQTIAIGIMMIPGGGPAFAFFKGFAAGMVASGGDLRAGLVGGVTAGMFYGVGELYGSGGAFAGMTGPERFASKVVLHGTVGGVSQDALGGQFKHGFLSAGFAEAATLGGVVRSIGGPTGAGQMAVAAIIGGTASSIGGGKFGNGAMTAAFGYAFNQLSHKAELNRTDFRNIATEAGRLRELFNNEGIEGLIRENTHLLGIKSEFTLREALRVAHNDVTFIEGAALAQHTSDIGKLFAFPGVPGKGFISTVINAASQLFSGGQLLFSPQATGKVGIPCATNGCEVFVGERQVQFLGRDY